MICSKTFLWSLQNSDLSSQQFGIILAEAQCPCVQSPFSIFYSTGQVSPDQWEGSNLHNWPIAAEENAFDNCMRGAMTAVTGVSSELNSDPFPAWSSHSHLVNMSQQFWPIRGSHRQLMTNQRTGHLRLGWKWRVRCSLQSLQLCSRDAAGCCMWNMFVSFLAAKLWWPSNCSRWK